MLVITILAFGGIIYAVTTSLKTQCAQGSHYDTTEKKCIETCQSGAKYYPSVGKCLQCPPGQISYSTCGCIHPCGEGMSQCGCSCISPHLEECIDNKPCNNAQSCENGKICCGDGAKCDVSVVQDCMPGYTPSTKDGCHWCTADKATGNTKDADKKCTVNTNKGPCDQDYCKVGVQIRPPDCKTGYHASEEDGCFFCMKDGVKCTIDIGNDKGKCGQTNYCTPGVEVHVPGQACKKCGKDSIICNGKCCNDNQLCTINGCCDKSGFCIDKAGNKTCCASGKCCNGKCCKAAGPDGKKTMICCDSGDGEKCVVSCSDSQSCDDTTCDPDAHEICFKDKFNKDGTIAPEIKYSCASKKCEWEPAIYNPPDEGATKTCSTDSSGKTLVSCNGGYKEPPGPYQKTGYVLPTATCGPNDCKKRLGDIKGVVEAEWEHTSGSDKGVCSATWDCNTYLPKCDACPLTSDQTRCCQDGGKFTGQICPQGTHCGLDESGTQICTTGYVCDYASGYMCDPIPVGKAIPAGVKKVWQSKKECIKGDPKCGSCGSHGERAHPPYTPLTPGAPCNCTSGWRGVLCGVPPISGHCYGAFPFEDNMHEGSGDARAGAWCYPTKDKLDYSYHVKACGFPNPNDSLDKQRRKCSGLDGSANATIKDPIGGAHYPAFRCFHHDSSTANYCNLSATHGDPRPPAPVLTPEEVKKFPVPCDHPTNCH